MTQQEFIARAREIHGDKYDYSKVDFTSTKKDIQIICPIHGEFTQNAGAHIYEKHGCKLCGIEKGNNSRRFNTNSYKNMGVGVNDMRYISNEKDKVFIRIWNSMLIRCYGKVYKAQKPTYIGCTVCTEWQTFSNFRKWCLQYYIDGYQLDKDILVKGNKVYSPETCCFVPQEINSIILNCKGSRGNLPIGVTRNKDKFEARYSVNGKRVYLGLYTNANKAFAAYKQAKENYIKSIAKKYFKEGKIAQKVYQALLNYNINIKD